MNKSEIKVDFADWKYVFTSEQLARFGSPHYGTRQAKKGLVKLVGPLADEKYALNEAMSQSLEEV